MSEDSSRPRINLGPARPPKGESGMRFFPDFALREAITAAIFFVILLTIAIVTKPPLEEIANPQASGYIPRPEWYFLWLFQTLKYFKGGLEPIGTVLVPTIGIGLLVAAPFLDRRGQPKTRVLVPGARPVRLWPRVVGAAGICTILGITGIAVASSHPMPVTGTQLTAAQQAGQDLFTQMGCPSCHTVGSTRETSTTPGPDLTNFGQNPNAQQLALAHFSGSGMGSAMPIFEMTQTQKDSLVAFLTSLGAKKP